MRMTTIEDLDLSVRAYNILKRARIDTVDQLQQLSDDDLLRLRNTSTHIVKEIREKVACVNTMTNADRIRAMSDEELADMLQLESGELFCQNKKECGDLLDTEDGIPEEMCRACALEWLRQPAEKKEE